MTTTDIATTDLTADEARRLTERIRLTAHTFAESRTKLIELVEEAKEGNAHAALGYASWTAYLSDVLGDEPLRLARDDRREMVAILSSEGMSTRAIAPIVGVSNKTVHEDLSTVTSGNSRPATVTSLDGRERPAKVETIRVDANTGEILDAATVSEPRNPPRRSLVDSARDAGQELRKAIERLERIATDDRFARNKNEVAAHLRHHLTHAIKVCQDLDNQIN